MADSVCPPLGSGPDRLAISLIIAAYNRGPRIARTIDSVLGQSNVPDEIIVVDDGSTDGTGAWVREHYPQVRVIETANGGTSAARNRGAREARGDVLVFLDHDDELMPHAVETLASLLAACPRARAAFADHTYMGTVSGVQFANHHTEQAAFRRMRAIPARPIAEGVRLYGRTMYYALLHGNLLQQPWAIYRETFLGLRGFAPEIRYCEDWDLYLRVADSVPLVVSDEVISHHHVDGDNLHLTPGQAEMYKKVIHRQLGLHRGRDWRARAILRRRLGMFHKVEGDLSRATSYEQAWKSYVRSFFAWPFDHVVAARLLMWPARMLAGRRPPSAPTGTAHESAR